MRAEKTRSSNAVGGPFSCAFELESGQEGTSTLSFFRSESAEDLKSTLTPSGVSLGIPIDIGAIRSYTKNVYLSFEIGNK